MFKKLFKFLAIIIAIIAIIFFLFAALAYLEIGVAAGLIEFSSVFSFMAGWGTIEFIIAGAIGLAVAFAIDGDAAGDVVKSVTGAVGSAVSAVVDGVSTVAGEAASSLLSSPVVIGALAAFGIYLVVKESN